MSLAVQLASGALGISSPNPAVGCVIVSHDGALLGRGRTQQTGGPHAEIMALRNAAASRLLRKSTVKEGAASPARMATMATTTISSISEKPLMRKRRPADNFGRSEARARAITEGATLFMLAILPKPGEAAVTVLTNG